VIAALALVAYLAAAAWCSVMDSVARIVDGAQRSASGNVDGRIEVHTTDETGLLADSLNDLRAQLQERLHHEQAKLEAQRHVIADIAHELGTPLGNIHVTPAR